MSVESKLVTASLNIEVYVDCPHCNYLINLMDERDTSGVYHNDEGNVVSQACPNGDWSEAHSWFEITEVQCSNCDGFFDIKGLEW